MSRCRTSGRKWDPVIKLSEKKKWQNKCVIKKVRKKKVNNDRQSHCGVVEPKTRG